MSRNSTQPIHGPIKCHVREAHFEDFDIIHDILTCGKSHFFGPTSRMKCHDADCFFGEFVAHRILVVENIEPNLTKAIGYAEFANFPTLEPLPKDLWPQWLKQHYCTQLMLNAANTLFFNFFVYSSEHVADILLAVLRECFLRESKLRYIIAVEMPEELNAEQQHYYVLEKYAKVYYPRDFHVMSCKNIQHLHIIDRETIITNLRYRYALPEDNDDCVDIIDKDRPEMRQELGDFYVAEELLNTNNNNQSDKLIVMESANTTAGFIWLNSEFDVMFFAKNFELDDFGHLIKFSANKPHNQFLIPSSSRVKRIQNELFSIAFVYDTLKKIECGEPIILENPSTASLGSQHIFKVISNSGIITISNENFYERGTTMKKLKIIDEIFRSLEYYVIAHKKYIQLSTNVSEKYRENIVTDHDTSSNQLEMMEYSNAFQLKIFGLHALIDVRRIIQIIITSFNAYPDRDYCVLTTSNTTKMCKLQQLQELFKYFVQIPSRVNCETNDSLYITYRGAIYGDLSVHLMRAEDVASIKNILNTQDSDEKGEVATVSKILAEAVKYDKASNFIIVTIRSGNASKSIDESIIVGYAILRRFTLMHELDEHFYISCYNYRLDESYAELITLKLHPCFRFQWQLVFRELARLTEFWHFIYILPIRCKSHPLTNDLWTYMQPIEPRRIKKVIYQREDIPTTTNDHINYGNDNFGVFHTNLCPVKWFKNMKNIVVIGFTDMTKAFLRSLIFSWNSTITSESIELNCCLPRLKVTVIAEPGLVEAEYDKDFECGHCYNTRICWINYNNSNAFIRDATKRIDFRIWINFIAGHVEIINTNLCTIKLKDGCEVSYDQLLLLCDTEFGPPHSVRQTGNNLPPNYAHINNRLDKVILYHKLSLLLEDNSNARILIYGAHVRTFEFINFLVTHGCNGNSITLVIPYFLRELSATDTINNPTQDINIERILLRMAEDLNITIHDEFNFSHWECYSDDESIKCTIFYGNITNERLEVYCDYFISYKETYMNSQFARVLQRSNIDVQNDNIIVNNKYQTSASNVYALGKYIQHSEESNHQYVHVSALEASEKIIFILNLLDKETQSQTSFDFKYVYPHYFQAQLPFNYHMANITIPKRYIANHLPNMYGPSMLSYDGDFCRIRLNENGIVEQILCVVRNNICLDFLQYFCGKHESLLNNLRAHWYLGEIDSFLKFFQQTWTKLILNDHFEEFRCQLRHKIADRAESVMNLSLERSYRKDMFRRYLNDLGITKEVHNNLLEFVRKHRDEFKHSFALPEDFNINEH